MITIGRFLAWSCPACGNWTVHQINDAWNGRGDHYKARYWSQLRLSCRPCHQSFAAKRADLIGLAVRHKFFDAARMAAAYAKDQNVQQLGNKLTKGFIKPSFQ